MTDLISFKGYRDGVTLIINDTEPDFQEILKQLKLKMSHLNFFKGSVVNIDIGQRDTLSLDQLNSLNDILSAKNIQIKDVILNGSNGQSQKPDASTQPSAPSFASLNGNTLMVERTIRSGQSLSYPGSIVLIGDVHPGGEVIAQGNVIVWGTLSGIVHAGCAGDKKAFIIALQLVPTQLRIAQYIGCAPDQAPKLPRKAEIAFLQNKRIVVEDYNTNKNMLPNFSEN